MPKGLGSDSDNPWTSSVNFTPIIADHHFLINAEFYKLVVVWHDQTLPPSTLVVLGGDCTTLLCSFGRVTNLYICLVYNSTQINPGFTE